jgi:hypothetical protein
MVTSRMPLSSGGQVKSHCLKSAIKLNGIDFTVFVVAIDFGCLIVQRIGGITLFTLNR